MTPYAIAPYDLRLAQRWRRPRGVRRLGLWLDAFVGVLLVAGSLLVSALALSGRSGRHGAANGLVWLIGVPAGALVVHKSLRDLGRERRAWDALVAWATPRGLAIEGDGVSGVYGAARVHARVHWVGLRRGVPKGIVVEAWTPAGAHVACVFADAFEDGARTHATLDAAVARLAGA